MSYGAVLLTLALMIPVAFLLGSVPFGYLLGRARGVDVRSAGSGNIGATNVGRLLGRRYFFLVLLLDALKAAVPLWVAATIVHTQTEPAVRTAGLNGLWLGIGLAALLGHIFSPFLGFRGGKGVATALGIVVGFVPFLTLPGGVALGVFVLVKKATGYVSAGSLAAAGTLPVAYMAFALTLDWQPFGRQWPVLLMCVLMAGLVVWRHRGNIRRLREGTEQRSI